MNQFPNQPPTITLTGQTAELQGQVFSAVGNNLLIGRQPGCQLQINHSQVSRQHVRIVGSGGHWQVEDLQSANGTTINGQRITGSHPIRTGDRLGLGNYEFVFHSSDEADRTLLATPAYQQPPQGYQQPMPPPQGYQQPPPGYTPPPQGYQQPPPGYAYQQPAPPRRRSCLGPCLIVTLILGLLVIIPTAVAGFFFYDEITDFVSGLPWPGNDQTAEGSNSRDALTVTSQQGGMVTTATGAAVLIPPGAVPPKENGEAGEMVFSMREEPDLNVSLPEPFQGVGSVYQLGPEGFTFNTPVMLSLPIPPEIDPDTILGVTYYDAASASWHMLPASIDNQKRLAIVATTHFSPWSLFGVADSERGWRNANGGTIRVVNGHPYETGNYPTDEGDLPYTVTYGVCVESYNLDNPELRWSWSPPDEWTMTVNDYIHPLSSDYGLTRQQDWWLPSGTYNLIEVWHFSEVNHSPLYSPRFSTYWRPIGATPVTAGSRQEFRYSEADLDLENFNNGRPPCFGIADTSVGTGDVQITLTWQASIDLDLHVVDPQGFEINYLAPSSPSGGQLDRDNRCDNIVIGRPENVFWPSSGAPSGTYTIRVNYYDRCADSGSVAYTVRTVVQGQVQTYSGTISPDNSPQEVTTFTLP